MLFENLCHIEGPKAFFAAGDEIRAIYEEYGDEEEVDGWVV